MRATPQGYTPMENPEHPPGGFLAQLWTPMTARHGLGSRPPAWGLDPLPGGLLGILGDDTSTGHWRDIFGSRSQSQHQPRAETKGLELEEQF